MKINLIISTDEFGIVDVDECYPELVSFIQNLHSSGFRFVIGDEISSGDYGYDLIFKVEHVMITPNSESPQIPEIIYSILPIDWDDWITGKSKHIGLRNLNNYLEANRGN